MDWTVFVAQEWMLVSILVVLVVALMITESKKGGSSLTHHDVVRLLNQDQAVLVDVREGKDFKAGHITNAIHIPHLKLAERIGELEKFKDKTIVVADKLGQHAGHCGKLLADKGFNAARLKGGMTEWFSQNLPVAKG